MCNLCFLIKFCQSSGLATLDKKIRNHLDTWSTFFKHWLFVVIYKLQILAISDISNMSFHAVVCALIQWNGFGGSFYCVIGQLADLRLHSVSWPAWKLWLTPRLQAQPSGQEGQPLYLWPSHWNTHTNTHARTHTHTHKERLGLRKPGFCTACLWNWFPLAPLWLLTFHWCSSIVRGTVTSSSVLDGKAAPSHLLRTSTSVCVCVCVCKCARVMEKERERDRERKRRRQCVCVYAFVCVEKKRKAYLLHRAMMWLLSSWTNFLVTASSIICFTCTQKNKNLSLCLASMSSLS